jgi:hypothetical protein
MRKIFELRTAPANIRPSDPNHCVDSHMEADPNKQSRQAIPKSYPIARHPGCIFVLQAYHIRLSLELTPTLPRRKHLLMLELPLTES